MLSEINKCCKKSSLLFWFLTFSSRASLCSGCLLQVMAQIGGAEKQTKLLLWPGERRNHATSSHLQSMMMSSSSPHLTLQSIRRREFICDHVCESNISPEKVAMMSFLLQGVWGLVSGGFYPLSSLGLGLGLGVRARSLSICDTLSSSVAQRSGSALALDEPCPPHASASAINLSDPPSNLALCGSNDLHPEFLLVGHTVVWHAELPMDLKYRFTDMKVFLCN